MSADWGTNGVGAPSTNLVEEGPTYRVVPLQGRVTRETALAGLPDDDRIRSFDAYRARMLALPEAIAVASPARREELCRILVKRVVVRDREVAAIDWTPPARPFFERQRECPQGDSNP